MRGKIFFIAILIIVLLMVWQYLPAVTIQNQPIIPDFQSSKHKKFEDAEPGNVKGYDSDGDGRLDYDEDVNNNGVQDIQEGETDRFDPDSDDDGLNDGREYKWWKNRYLQQTEAKSIPMWVKALHPNFDEKDLFNLYLPEGDLDGDGNANILDFDSDSDGLSDGYEIDQLGTDPANPDSDGDGVLDSEDPNPLENVDKDNDGMPDDWEAVHNVSDPEGDADDDGIPNKDDPNPNDPDGTGGDFSDESLDVSQFYENDFNNLIFKVTPINNPKYWRLTAYDNYEDNSWSHSDETMHEYTNTISYLDEVTKYLVSENRTYNIQFYGTYNGYMPTALHTTNMFNLKPEKDVLLGDGNFPTIQYDSEIGFYIGQKMRSYSFASTDYSYSEYMLERAVVANGSSTSRYLQLPSEINTNILLTNLSQDVIKDAENDFGKATEISKYLKTSYNYNLSYSLAEEDEDPILDFLFSSKKGICVHFASAFVFLCRMNNIPARFVTGFALGDVVKINITSESNSTTTEYYRTVREGHKHAWAEVWFEELGWISFEVTGYNSGFSGGTGVSSNGTDSTVHSDDDFGGDGGGTLKGDNQIYDWGDLTGDDDGDGLTNGEEKELGTNPKNPDTDGDGLPDWDEVMIHYTNPKKKDTDGDKLTDYEEVHTEYSSSVVDWDGEEGVDNKTNPNDPDTDGGGTWDGIEVEAGSNPLNPLDDEHEDTDSDGLSDSEERIYGTDITDPDTDHDGLFDGPEVHIHKTNPLDNDTDDDGLLDGEEVNTHGTNPNSYDTDMDMLNDYYEIYTSFTNPIENDTDEDGLMDGLELDASDGNVTDPLNDDTDGDGQLDGKEDRNKNGRVDSLLPDDWNDDEGPGETDPLVKDTDGGGLWDGTEAWAKLNPLDPNDDNTTADSDRDGLTDTQEITLGTNPFNHDTDSDGLIDGKEVNVYHTDPLNKDTEGDNITDSEEVWPGQDGYITNPNDWDTDNDTLSDWNEIFKYKTDPTVKDTDGDKLTDGFEVISSYSNSSVDWDGDGNTDFKTDPNNADTDSGGIDDGTEVWNDFEPLNENDDKFLKDDDGDGLSKIMEDFYGTNASDPDSDDDGLEDGEEVHLGSDGYITDPLDYDSDNDSISDGKEVYGDLGYKTNPNNPDHDGDGLHDYDEFLNNTDPTQQDTDKDGLTDFIELDNSDGNMTDPTSWDSDGDGLPDGWIDTNKNGSIDVGEFEDRNLNGRVDFNKSEEWNNGTGPGETDPNNADTDGGQATDWMEILRGHNPLNGSDDHELIDTDSDGLPDVEEDLNNNGKVDPNETDPNNPDTDGEGLLDGEEVYGKHGYITNATNNDTDNDTLDDYHEIYISKTNPINNDTDGDTLLDGDEIIKYGTDPKKKDTDDDGIPDNFEVSQGRRGKSNRASSYSRIIRNQKTDPKNPDTDGDGLPDGWKDGWGYNITSKEWGLWENTTTHTLQNGQPDRGILVADIILAEYEDKSNFNVRDEDETDPLKFDTDGGGAWDGDEVIFDPDHPKNPVNNSLDDWDVVDTDRDGLTNIYENASLLNENKFQTKWNVSDTDDDDLWDGYDVDTDYDGSINYKGELVGHNGFAPTYPNSSDSDGDGLSDGDEVNNFGTDPLDKDTDDDGLDDWEELNKGVDGHVTSPELPDSDYDGLWDGMSFEMNETQIYGEMNYSTDPNLWDTDGDYLSDGEEIMNWHTNPLTNDTDGGGVLDGTEILFRNPPSDPLNPSDDIIVDSDLDGLFNHIENDTEYPYSTVDWDGISGVDHYTNWIDNDTDDDGLIDGEEVLVLGTNPLHNDTDNDTISDFDELNGVNNYFTDPLNPDTDEDGLSDILEIKKYWTDPTKNDTDGGGVDDYSEIMIYGTNPNNKSDDGKSTLPMKGSKIILHTIPRNFTKGKYTIVKGNVTDDNGEGLYGASVKIYMSPDIENTPLALAGSTIVQDKDGEFEIICRIPEIIFAGPNQLVGYSASLLRPTEQYNESWSYDNPEQPNSTFYVYSDTILRFIAPRFKINQDARLEGEGNLTDLDNIPIPDRNVSIFLNNDILIQIKTTDGEGLFKYSFIMEDIDIGEHNLSIHFYGDEYLTKSSANYTITVRSDMTKIEISLDKEEVVVNEKILLEGSITGLDDEPIKSTISVFFYSEEYDLEIEKIDQSRNGTFKIPITIDKNEFKAGDYEVYVEFPGSKTYSEDTSNVLDLFVQGSTSFRYNESFVSRDSGEIIFECYLKDNQYEGIVSRFVEVKIPLHGYNETLISGTNGLLEIPFTVMGDDPLGAVDVHLKFDGTRLLQGNTTIAKLNIKSETRINFIEFPWNMTRTEDYVIKGKVSDDRDQNVASEKISIYMGSDSTTRKYFTVTTDNNGNFVLSILVPRSFPLGVNRLEFQLTNSTKYVPSSNGYDALIFCKPGLTIESNTTVQKGEVYNVIFRLTEDNGEIPIKKSIIILYVNDVLASRLITDQFGKAHYEGIFPTDVNSIRVYATYNGTEFYTNTEAELTLKIEEPEKKSDYYTSFMDYWFIFVGFLAIIIIAALWIRWRRRHIPEVQELLTDLLSKLETTDKSRRIIYDTYLKLLEILRRYGFIRKDSETPREFENAVQDALPNVSTRHLDSLTSLFEEARYSTHRLGKSKRSRAIRNLKNIRHNLEA